MDDQTSSVLVEFLDTNTKFNYINYYYQNVLIETDGDVYAYIYIYIYIYILYILYEWWWQQEGFYPR